MDELWSPCDWYDYGYACGESGWGWLRTVAGQCLTHADRGSLAAGWRAGQDAAALREAVRQADAEAAEQRMWEAMQAYCDTHGELMRAGPVGLPEDAIPF